MNKKIRNWAIGTTISALLAFGTYNVTKNYLQTESKKSVAKWAKKYNENIFDKYQI